MIYNYTYILSVKGDLNYIYEQYLAISYIYVNVYHIYTEYALKAVQSTYILSIFGYMIYNYTYILSVMIEAHYYHNNRSLIYSCFYNRNDRTGNVYIWQNQFPSSWTIVVMFMLNQFTSSWTILVMFMLNQFPSSWTIVVMSLLNQFPSKNSHVPPILIRSIDQSTTCPPIRISNIS